MENVLSHHPEHSRNSSIAPNTSNTKVYPSSFMYGGNHKQVLATSGNFLGYSFPVVTNFLRMSFSDQLYPPFSIVSLVSPHGHRVQKARDALYEL
jgi:hypothetical protein